MIARATLFLGALSINTREYQSAQVGYEFGRNFGADYALWTGALKRKLTFGALQVVYQRGTAEFGQRSNQGHTPFMKASTVF